MILINEKERVHKERSSSELSKAYELFSWHVRKFKILLPQSRNMLHLISSRKMKMENVPVIAIGPSKVKEVLLIGQVLLQKM